VWNMATKKTPRAAILVRVSTKKQDTARQVAELKKAAKAKGWKVVTVIHETMSGSAGNGAGWDIAEEREALERTLELAEAGEIDKVMVHEVSRVARRNSDAHRFLERLTDAKVSLYWHAQQIETLLRSGKPNPAASLMFALLAEIARNERETSRERIMSGLDEARRKGKTLGRPVGTGVSTDEFLRKHADIRRRLGKGLSIRETAAATGKGVSTVQRVKAALEL
jgi:DNA invertase Pin-like site-specific DNA recombinase